MSGLPPNRGPISVQAALEKQFIADHLHRSGLRIEDLKSLPPDLARKLMTAASQYASLKLAEIESCSQFMRKIHLD